MTDWNHLAIVYDGLAKQARIYVNGQLGEAACIDGNGDGQADDAACVEAVPWSENVISFEALKSLQLGRAKGRGSFGDYWPGAIDDVWTFQGALSDAQISRIASELDPLRGQPTGTVDTNGKRTILRYDALGRSTKVWLADRRSTTLQPNYQFDYYVEEGKPATVATRTLNSQGGQRTSYTLYDGYLRTRQTQTPGPDAGWLISDTFYDERGLVAKTFAPYYVTGKPERELFKPADALSVESQTWKTYDGLGRETESRDVAGNGEGGKVLAVTKTLYGGDRTTVIPPEGGTATTTVSDARGQTTQLLQHHTRAADAPAETTRYTYTPAGKLDSVTDPAGNKWAYQYDQLGNQTWSKDPDKGATKAAFRRPQSADLQRGRQRRRAGHRL